MDEAAQPTTVKTAPSTPKCATSYGEDNILITDIEAAAASSKKETSYMFTLCSGIALLRDALDRLDGQFEPSAFEAALDIIDEADPNTAESAALVAELRQAI